MVATSAEVVGVAGVVGVVAEAPASAGEGGGACALSTVVGWVDSRLMVVRSEDGGVEDGEGAQIGGGHRGWEEVYPEADHMLPTSVASLANGTMVQLSRLLPPDLDKAATCCGSSTSVAKGKSWTTEQLSVAAMPSSFQMPLRAVVQSKYENMFLQYVKERSCLNFFNGVQKLIVRCF